MSNVAALLPIIRGEISKLRIPQAADKVYKDECVLSFDSPFSDTGLYVNMATYKGYGRDYLDLDIKSTGCKLYLHELWNQIEKTPDETNPQIAPSKLAIGVEGGFMGESQYEIIKEHFLVVVNGSNLESIRLPCSELPEFVSNVAQGIINHDGMKSNLQVQTWDADNERFVSRYADKLEQINPEGKKIPQDPKLWRDEATGDTENLWLNLSTGYIGGGRKMWDGSGGSGSALAHYEATGRKYPLVVKLGTITPHGADIYSYAPEEDAMVLDPHLADHLSFWGIDIMKMEKTGKTMSELEVALNMSYDWSKMMDGAEKLEPVTGPGLVGLRNIGSSCYLNSAMQTILAIPEVQERYLLQRDNIIVTAPADPTADFAVQLSKLAAGLLTDRYVPPAPPQSASHHSEAAAAAAAAGDARGAKGADLVGEEAGKVANLEKYVIAPRMFKHVVGKGHPEFSSGRQQDVSEFFQYFLNVLSKAERVSLPRVVLPGAARAVPTAALFEYHVEERFHCPATNEVKYSPTGPGSLFNTLDLPVPMDKAVPYVAPTATTVGSAGSAAPAQKRARLEGKDSEGDAKEYDMCVDSASSDGVGNNTGAGVTPPAGAEQPELFVPFAACLEEFLKPSEVEMTSAAAGARMPFLKSLRFQTFPRYLMVKMGRYYVGPNWVQVKITARIDVPEELDLTPYKARGPQPDEQLMSETAATTAGSNTTTAGNAAPEPFVINEELVEGLMQMGFSANGCRRAAVATRNADLETAMNWIIEHMEDPDFNDPPVLPEAPAAASGGATASQGGAAVDPEAMMMLTSMGYNEAQVGAALKATDNNIERAADWLFSHADDLDAAVAQVLSGSTSGGSATGSSTSAALPDDATAEGRYTLMAVISHMGKNTDHGHYICHIKKDGQWVLFNDEKVGKCSKPPLEHGFMYLYRRNDGPGTFAV